MTGSPFSIWGPFGVSREGVLVSARITLKSNAILLAFITLIASNTVATLGSALGRLRVPEKIIYLLLLNYRYIFVMEEEYRRLLRSASIRGFRPSSNLHTYKTYAYLIGMLFVMASDRAERVYKAMLCRGFAGRFYSLHEFSFSRLDLIWLVVVTIAVIGGGDFRMGENSVIIQLENIVFRTQGVNLCWMVSASPSKKGRNWDLSAIMEVARPPCCI